MYTCPVAVYRRPPDNLLILMPSQYELGSRLIDSSTGGLDKSQKTQNDRKHRKQNNGCTPKLMMLRPTKKQNANPLSPSLTSVYGYSTMQTDFLEGCLS